MTRRFLPSLPLRNVTTAFLLFNCDIRLSKKNLNCHIIIWQKQTRTLAQWHSRATLWKPKWQLNPYLNKARGGTKVLVRVFINAIIARCRLSRANKRKESVPLVTRTVFGECNFISKSHLENFDSNLPLPWIEFAVLYNLKYCQLGNCLTCKTFGTKHNLQSRR